jgi:4-amino-4-deoxy-L-arabinose transferase-like glycosyltransferase
VACFSLRGYRRDWESKRETVSRFGLELCRQRHLYTGPTMRSAPKLITLLMGPGVIPILFMIYLLPRVAVIFLDTQPFSDAGWYFNRGIALASGHGYSEGGVPTAFWPPGWSWVMSLLFRLFGPSLRAVQIFNLVCSLATGWLTLDLGRRLFNSELAARTGLLLLAIYPNAIGYVPLVWTEVFYTTLLLLGCWLIVARHSTGTLTLAGLVFGLATLVKTQTLIVIPFIFGIDLLRGEVSFKAMRTILLKCAAVVAFALVVVLPWSYRNYRIFGEWILVSTNGGLTLLTGNNPSARGDYTQDDALVTSIPRNVANQIEVDKEAKRRALQWIKENPGRFVALLPLKVFRLWIPDGESEWSYQAGYRTYHRYVLWFRTVRYINQVYYSGLLIMFVWTGVVLFAGKKRISGSTIDWWALPYILALYLTVIALVFSGQSRFHYPIMPFVMMCCGWLLVTLYSDDTLHRRPTPSMSEHPNS